MNILDRARGQHYLNTIMSSIGLVGSLWIVGWVDHPQSLLIGGYTFATCLVLLIGSTISYLGAKRLSELPDESTSE